MAGPNPPYERSGRGVLEASPPICVPAFREAVLARLADEDVVGIVQPQANSPESLSYEVGRSSGSMGGAADADLDAMPIGEERPARAYDRRAWRLSPLDGTPRSVLSWPEPRRDEAIAALSASLRRHGNRYEATAAAGRASPFEGLARLASPRLDRPATPADVEAGRAIFRLGGRGGEVRVVPLAEAALPAVWTTLEETSLAYRTTTTAGESRIRRDFDRTGRVWQAEELRVGDRWGRSFGFQAHLPGGRVVDRSEADPMLDQVRPPPGIPRVTGPAAGPSPRQRPPDRAAAASFRTNDTRLGPQSAPPGGQPGSESWGHLNIWHHPCQIR